jgi:hypothetical protein
VFNCSVLTFWSAIKFHRDYNPRVRYSTNDAPQSPSVHLALFADDTYIYTTDRKEGCVLRKLQRGLTSVGSWCEHWNIRINEDKTQAIYFSRGNRPSETSPILKVRNIPFESIIKYIGVIFDRKIT